MASLIHFLQHTLQSKDPALTVETKRLFLKEALQVYLLDFLYNHPNYRRLNFYGGSCLRVVYGLNRLSEDLDLDNSAGVDLSPLGKDLADFFRVSLGSPAAEVKSQQGRGGILRLTVRLPVLYELGLSPHPNESLHLKVEISHHKQIAVVQHTPVFSLGRSFVPAHFSLETIMAAKMLACLERSFHHGRDEVFIKGRDFYDLLWLMQRGVWPLEEKLAKEGKHGYTVPAAMQALKEKVAALPVQALAVDLFPLFEHSQFITAWLEHFHENFARLVERYTNERPGG